jgi:hypothetical protein
MLLLEIDKFPTSLAEFLTHFFKCFRKPHDWFLSKVLLSLFVEAEMLVKSRDLVQRSNQAAGHWSFRVPI